MMITQTGDPDARGTRLERREHWLEASIEIATELLAPGLPPMGRLVETARRAAFADLAVLILPAGSPDLLRVHVAAGLHAEEILDEEFPAAAAVSWQVMEAGEGALLRDLSQGREGEAEPHGMRFGPTICVPLCAGQVTRGAMSMLRVRGAEAFDELDLEFATAFAANATLALELTDARAVAEEVAVLADRERIARDLHDHVIQRLFAAGLTIDAVAMSSGADIAARLEAAQQNIETAMVELRTSIFGLRGGQTPGAGPLRSRVLAICGELAPVLGFEPHVTFSGPLDHIAAGSVLTDVEAVLHECLTNVAKHAGAGRCDVLVTGAADALSVEVSDDGVGLAGAARRSELQNLSVRAERRGGKAVVGAAPPGRYAANGEGTSLTWTIPLR